MQDTACDAWAALEERVERAERDRVTEFAPLDDMSGEDRALIVTLPASIARLSQLRKLRLYGSHIVRMPTEIGELRALEYLDIYTSYRLHYLPYELTRCTALKDSRMSTRALYGNYKNRCHFPELADPANAATLEYASPLGCSVCREPYERKHVIHRWITLALGTDWVPLLVFACSTRCLHSLPTPPEGYVQKPHGGGKKVIQPRKEF